MTSPHQVDLDRLAEAAQERLTLKHTARERALQLSRSTIRSAANTIRAVHRRQLPQARQLLQEVAASVKEAQQLLKPHPDLYFTGFVQDAQKEYTEASATLAFIAAERLPTRQQLGVELPPYLNGLAEAASELRRYILDSLRRDDTATCEQLMETMDQVYSLLVTIDFPDALTGGLRHTTDALRGVLERTRGDLTTALRQHALERRLSALENQLTAAPAVTAQSTPPAEAPRARERLSPEVRELLARSRPPVARAFRALRQAILDLGADVLEVPEKGRVVYRRHGVSKPRGWQNFCTLFPQRRQVKVFLGPKERWQGQNVKTDKHFAWYLLTPGRGRRDLRNALPIIQQAYETLTPDLHLGQPERH